MRLLLFLAGLFVPLSVQAQGTTLEGRERHTVAGSVTDALTNAPLPGATVYAPALGMGATTDTTGWFAMSVPAGALRLVVSYVGYRNEVMALTVAGDVEANIRLVPDAASVGEVFVDAERTEPVEKALSMSRHVVPAKLLAGTPRLFGEADPLKALQLLPGAQSGFEGTTGIHVRGGSPDQNLILLDGAPIYNASHLFGLYSVFNASTVRDVQLISGGFPARYGGRLSSVVEVNLRDGDLRRFRADAMAGLIASSLTLEGPVVKDRVSIIASARRSYAGAVVREVVEEAQHTDYAFYDIQARLNGVLSSRDALSVSVYTGSDDFARRFDEERRTNFAFDFGWRNVVSSVRWRHSFSRVLVGTASATASRYRTAFGAAHRKTDKQGYTEIFEIDSGSGVEEAGLGADFQYAPGARHSVRFGGRVIGQSFDTGSAASGVDGAPIPTAFRTHSVRGYAEEEWLISPTLGMGIGVHAGSYRSGRQRYGTIEPRLTGRLMVGPRAAATVSYAASRQFQHLLTTTTIGLPTDVWAPVTSRIGPQEGRQIAVGMAGASPGGAYTFSLEGYVKRMRGLIEYREGAAVTTGLPDRWEDRIAVGRGTSRGIEALVRRTSGPTTGWVGYTLSRSDRRFPELNGGRPFPYRYDRRNEVEAVVFHRVSGSVELSGAWVYSTGMAVTMPQADYLIVRAPGAPSPPFDPTVHVYGPRNGFRMPPYHRLDVSVRVTRPLRFGVHTFQAGVYNLYNRRNPYFYYVDETEDGVRQMKRVVLFPILPSLSYQVTY